MSLMFKHCLNKTYQTLWKAYKKVRKDRAPTTVCDCRGWEGGGGREYRGMNGDGKRRRKRKSRGRRTQNKEQNFLTSLLKDLNCN